MNYFIQSKFKTELDIFGFSPLLYFLLFCILQHANTIGELHFILNFVGSIYHILQHDKQ